MVLCFFLFTGCFLEENVVYKDAVAVNRPKEDKKQNLESCRAHCLALNTTYFQWRGPNSPHNDSQLACLCTDGDEIGNRTSKDDVFVGDTRCDGRFMQWLASQFV